MLITDDVVDICHHSGTKSIILFDSYSLCKDLKSNTCLLNNICLLINSVFC